MSPMALARAAAIGRSPTPRQGRGQSGEQGGQVRGLKVKSVLKENMPVEVLHGWPKDRIKDLKDIKDAAAPCAALQQTPAPLPGGALVDRHGQLASRRGIQAHQPLAGSAPGSGGARGKAAAPVLQVFVDDDLPVPSAAAVAGLLAGVPAAAEQVQRSLPEASSRTQRQPLLQLQSFQQQRAASPRPGAARAGQVQQKLQRQLQELELLQQELRKPLRSLLPSAVEASGARAAGQEPPNLELPALDALEDLCDGHAAAALILRGRLAAVRDLRSAWAAGDAAGVLGALQAQASSWPAGRVRGLADRLEPDAHEPGRLRLLAALRELGGSGGERAA